MKMELREAHKNLERLEMEWVELDRQRPRGREDKQRKMNPEVRELTSFETRARQQDTPRARREDNNDRVEELRRFLVETEEQLEKAEELGLSKAKLQARIARTRAALRQAQRGQVREPARSGPAQEEIQGQVEELRQKVDGMSDQMQEMREMLHQLLQQRQTAENEQQLRERRRRVRESKPETESPR